VICPRRESLAPSGGLLDGPAPAAHAKGWSGFGFQAQAGPHAAPPVVSHGAMPLSSTQLCLTDLLGPALGPLDWSSTRGLRQGIYSGVKCNGLHATKLVKSHHLLRGQLEWLHATRLAMSRHLLRDQLQRVACDQIGDGSPFAQGSIATICMR
jgi:hypothetical protein